MTLFESGYKAAAKTELERKIREREDKDKVAQTRTDFSENTGGTQSNIAFAQRFTEDERTTLKIPVSELNAISIWTA